MANDRFSAEATAWDSSPFIQLMTDRAWETIQKRAADVLSESRTAQKPNVLEIGAGTGLLTLKVAPAAEMLVAVDVAEGMVDALRAKLAKPGAPTNVRTILAALDDPEDDRLPPAGSDENGAGPRMKFDLITSHLVLHHIPDLEGVLGTMLGCLVPGGRVALTDFEDFGPEARRFHPESKMEGVERHGIKREAMAGLMERVGFVDVAVEVAWTANKAVERYPGEFDSGEGKAAADHETMDFPFLICLGRKAE